MEELKPVVDGLGFPVFSASLKSPSQTLTSYSSQLSSLLVFVEERRPEVERADFSEPQYSLHEALLIPLL